MDYEKKYNEALERAQKTTRAGGDVAMVIVQNIFPELRESEDERIRKGLIEVVSDIAGGWPFEEHRITKKEALAYLERQKEQKPEERFKEAREKYQVEWNEEDEKIRNSLIASLSRIGANTRTDSTSINYTFPREIAWLKSLRPQPKVELSEDVKKTLDEVSHILVGLNYKQIAKDYKQAVEKLLSIRPSWKLSEQEKGALRTAIHILTDERSFPKAAAHLQDILNAFEGKESRKDWKPSEEQMQGLAHAIDLDVYDAQRYKLDILYYDLKKLM